ncbi:MAG TPA: hypothetical protein VIM14_18925, partial [Polyangia bacterium]
PYTITDNISVGGNATLTIEAGVRVLFDPETILSIGSSSTGRLSAVGTATFPITFTSSNTTPGAGDWAGVELWGSTSNGTILSYVNIDYCGSKGDACLVSSGVKPNRVIVDHVTFSNVGADAIWEQDADSNFTISNCTFNDIPATPTQRYAISVYAPSFAGIDSTNTFSAGAMVELMGGDISVDTLWKNIATDVAVTNNLNIGGAATPTLNIAAGSKFKFATDTGIRIGYGDPGKLALNGTGTATGQVTLTSLAVTPGAGDWIGIVVWYSSSAKIANSTIAYAGSTNDSSSNGAVSVVSNDDSLDIQSSKISYSGQYGIGVPCNSTAPITNTGNTFTGNVLGDVGPGPSGVACP